MRKPNSQDRRALWTVRGFTTFLAAVPLALASFSIGYDVGADRLLAAADTVGDETDGTTDHRPVAATFTATGSDTAPPAGTPALPVGTSEGLGITVTHLQFVVDESTLAPDHTAELRLPMLVAPDDGEMMLEVASVEPVACLCALAADGTLPFGNVWDSAMVDPQTREVVFDVTGAIDAPGRYGFAVTTPDSNAYLELEGTGIGGPVLRTLAPPEPDPTPPTPSRTPPPTPDSASAIGEPQAESGQADTTLNTCRTGAALVPNCGALIGAAAGAHTNLPKEQAFLDFEATVDRPQQIYHAYERADSRLFPTPEQIELTTDPDRPRTLLINWKPRMASWAEIAAGDPEVDAYLSELASHIKSEFDRPFFFTVHHEPENDVIAEAGSGMEASDYAQMYRYVVTSLRSQGVDNLVTVMNYMGYLKWVETPWHDELYPGDDVVDWIGLSGYGHSLHDDGHSDFTEIVDEPKPSAGWPGFYHWVAEQFPDKPLMLAEWGAFEQDEYPRHQETVFRAAADQFAYYPRLKAIVYFSSPNAEGRNSEVDGDAGTLEAFRDLMRSKHFDVRLE